MFWDVCSFLRPKYFVDKHDTVAKFLFSWAARWWFLPYFSAVLRRFAVSWLKVHRYLYFYVVQYRRWLFQLTRSHSNQYCSLWSDWWQSPSFPCSVAAWHCNNRMSICTSLKYLLYFSCTSQVCWLHPRSSKVYLCRLSLPLQNKDYISKKSSKIRTEDCFSISRSKLSKSFCRFWLHTVQYVEWSPALLLTVFMGFRQRTFLDLALLSRRISFKATIVVRQPPDFTLAAISPTLLSLYFPATCFQ